jgi:hypothetical protein
LTTQRENQMIEADITISGETLTSGESMTFRVAIESFAQNLHNEGLGDDDHGKAITQGYLANIDSIRNKMFKKEVWL